MHSGGLQYEEILAYSASLALCKQENTLPNYIFHFRSKRLCYTNPQNPSDFKGPTNTCDTAYLAYERKLNKKLRLFQMFSVSSSVFSVYCVVVDGVIDNSNVASLPFLTLSDLEKDPKVASCFCKNWTLTITLYLGARKVTKNVEGLK